MKAWRIYHEGAVAGPLDRDRRGLLMETWVEQEVMESVARVRGDEPMAALHRTAQRVILEAMVRDRSN